MQDLSQVRKKIYDLNQKRWALTEKIMKSGSLLTAQYYERYTKCGNPTCKCATGELHGPFPWIYQNGKRKKSISTSCVAEKVELAKEYSKNYTEFKENIKEIKELNEEINKLFKEIEELNEVDAELFTKKAGEKRGRKQKKSEGSNEKQEN